MTTNASAASTPEDRSFRSDPVFILSKNRSVHLSKDTTGAAADYLARWLARRPQDLTRHVQRIQLHIDRDEPGRLFAALIDLFIALGRHGAALRKRMLAAATGRLSPERLRLLNRLLPTGLAVHHRLGDIPGSVLSLPISGTLDLVERAGRTVITRSTLDEAKDLLDEGQVAAAQSLLEWGLFNDPLDTALAEELLIIYRATRNRDAYLTFRKFLEGAHALPASWEEVAELTGGHRV